MVQLSRKKVKGFTTNVVELDLGKDSLPMPPLVVRTNHDSGSISLQLEQFAEGTHDVVKYPLIQNRFSGRPALIEALAPHLQSKVGDKRKATAVNAIAVLRRWWVFFDSIAEEHAVNTIEDIDDFIGFKQVRIRDFSGNYRTDFLWLVNEARKKRSLPILYWPSHEDEDPTGNLPHFPHVKIIYHSLKQYFKGVTQRWDTADRLAAQGRDWSGGLQARHSRIHGKWTDAESHATYRGAIERLGNPTPTRLQLGELLARPNASAVQNVVVALEGLYPRILDVQYFLYLFLLRTGWNAGTALELDVETCIIDHPTSAAHHVVRSIKNRGQTEQIAIGLNKSQLSPGNIIRLLIARTKPLRKAIIALLHDKEIEYKSTGTEAALEDLRNLRLMAKSPWLYVTRDGGIRHLTGKNYLPVTIGAMKGSGLQLIIRDINKTLPQNEQIAEGMTVGDFRDAYISFAYESSGYSWLVAKLAAGHRSLETLRTYLRKRHWKAHGEKKVHAWGEALWSEITVHRSIDPAILFARVQRGEISEEERARWTHRTHVGTGCSDFTKPPEYLAPDHVDGAGCRVQRCTLCHQGILFDDSYDHLARRLAELAHLQATMPLLAWMQSSFPEEMENTERALSQFDSLLVSERLQFWREEIKTGRYIPISFEGAY